jgi:tetratricopeptide (TPR) repeat protein
MKIFRRKTVKIPVIAAALTTLVLLGCSSAPEEPTEVSEKKNQAAEYIVFGNNYYEQAQFGQALNFFELALDLNISVDNEPGIAKNYNSLGKTWLALGNQAQAQQYYQQAYDLASRIGEKSTVYQSAYNLGEIYLKQNETETARTLMEQALKDVSSDEEASAELAILYHGMGMLYRTIGIESQNNEDSTAANQAYNQSLGYFEQAVRINQSLDTFGQLASNYFMMASVHNRQNNLERAKSLALLALENDRKVENSRGIALDNVALGIIEEKLGNNSEAYNYYIKAFRIYQTLELVSGLRRTAEALIRITTALDRTSETAVYQQVLEQLQ